MIDEAQGGDDTLEGGAGDDALYGGPGSDVISGGTGFDIAGFDGLFAAYTIASQGNRVLVTEIASGDTDTLRGVEQLVFDDVTLMGVAAGGGQTEWNVLG